MAKNQESINRSLFELLRSRGYAPDQLDTSGNKIPVAEEAEVFQFKFTKDGEEYGTVTASIDGLHKLIIYFGDDVANSEKEDNGGDDSWYKLLNHLKRFAQKHQLSFEVKNRDHLKYDMAKREHMKKQERISEGYYPMGKKASYNDNIPTVKIVIEHSRTIEEGEQRYRNVNRIFLENTQGERILAPTTKPGVAQVYARHLAEGGMPHDDRWNHIISLCEEYNKMGAFVRATRNNQFNESAQQLVNEGINHYQSLRESLSKMRGARGYNAYFESYTPPLMEDDSEENNLNELFVQETLDPRIESVMPILSKLHKKVAEMKEVNELSEWADSLTEVALEKGDEEIDEAMFPASKIGDKLRDIKTGANDLGAGSALKAAGIASPALGAAATGAATAGLSGALPSTIPGMANLSIAGAEGALIYLPVIGAGALGATAAALGGFLTYKGLNWLAQKLFGTKEEAIEFAKLHLEAAEAGKPNFEFQGKSYPVKIKNKEDASDLMMRVYELETQLKESLTEEDDLDEGILDTVKKVGSKVFDKLGGGSEEDLIRDLQKSAGVPQTGKKPEPKDKPVGEGLDDAQKADQKINTPAVQRKEKGGDWKVTKQDLDKADEKNMTSPSGMSALKKRMNTIEEDEVDESALQASFGIKKYGKKGMDALRKAGQDHASKNKMQNIRAKFSNKEKPVSEGQEELDAMLRLLGEGWKGELSGGTLGGVGGTVAGSALGALATGSPIGAAIGGVVGGALGGTGGQMAGRELTKEDQLNEVAPLLAAGARVIMPLLARVGPALGRMASTAGKTGSEVAGKAATGIGRGTADVAKSAAQSAAQNAGKIGVGAGAYQAITDVANSVVGGVGEVYHDAGKAASAIGQAVGNAIDEKTIVELGMAAVKYSIPIGILLAVLYGGKKLIDQVMSEGLAGAAVGGALAGATGGPALAPLGAFAGNAIGDTLGSSTSNKGSPAQVTESTLLQGQEDLDVIKRLIRK